MQSSSFSEVVIPVSLTVPGDETTSNTLTVTYSDGVSRATFDSPNHGLTEVELSNLATFLNDAASLTAFHTALLQREENHPRKKGFIALPFSDTMECLSAAHIDRAANNYDSETTMERLGVPEEFGSPRLGWFPAGSDANVFGTLYLVPVGRLIEETDQFYRLDLNEEDERPDYDNFKIGWAVGQVGVEHARWGYAQWDDAEGVQNLIDVVLAYDQDTALSVQALQNSEALQKATQIYRRRSGTVAARDAFTATPLRPRQIPQIAIEAAKSARISLMNDGYPSWSGKEGCYLFTLDGYEVFGWGSSVKPANAVYRVAFERDDLAPATVKRYITKLQETLVAKRLYDVSVVQVEGQSRYVYLTRNTDAFIAHREVFNISADEDKFAVTHIPAERIPASAARRKALKAA